MYLIGAWYANSFNPIDVAREIVTQGYPLIILLIAAAQYYFLEFANGRLVELAFNEVGIQARYFNEESQWIDWDDVKSVQRTFTTLIILGKLQEQITIPLYKFTASDRKHILQQLKQNTASTQR